MSPRTPHRFYYPGHFEPDGDREVMLTPEESHHLMRVLRILPGAQVDVFDAAGRAWTGEFSGTEDAAGGRRLARVRLLFPLPEDTLPGADVNLAVALIKRRPMDWMIEKLSELGVDTLQPLITERTVVPGDSETDRPSRWDRLAISAAKQCGRNRPLAILPPLPLRAWLERSRPPALTAFAHGDVNAPPLGQWLIGTSETRLPYWLVIGPEGGWTRDELEQFTVTGFNPVQMGPLTLRAETAAIAAAAACRLIAQPSRVM